MTLELAYNTTDSPVLVDEQGYLIGGRSWGAVDTTDPIGSAELDAGRIVLADEDAVGGASDNADAQAAIANLEDRRARFEEAKSLSKDELIDQLDDDTLARLETGGDGKPAKDDLVDAVAAAADESKTTKPRSGRK